MDMKNDGKILVFIPTYNERDNVEKLVKELYSLGVEFDILFIDDNSPDKTGEVLEQLSKTNQGLHVVHRPQKMGVGSAHIAGIQWAYENRYDILITMDSDFSHSPSHILKLLDQVEVADVVVGSRFIKKNSLSEWNILRKFLTNIGHLTTKLFLKMPFDATGAFRLYRIDRIPPTCFSIEKSQGYSFFFESLFILFRNHFKIKEVAIDLPARTYGHSKMELRDAIYSLIMLWKMVFSNIFNSQVFFINQSAKEIRQNTEVKDEQGWDEYWEKQQSVNNWLYDRIALFFREYLIRPYLNKYVHKYFPKGASLLHAGCGSGQVDIDITNEYPVIAMDISINALKKYRLCHSQIQELIQNDIKNMDLDDESIDGIYSLGVLEHFYEPDILLILKEFRRVLKNRGKVVVFWPPVNGLSVLFLGFWHFIMNKILGKSIKLHPTEVSLLQSKSQAVDFADKSGFKLIDYQYGLNDLFTQVIIVLEKTS